MIVAFLTLVSVGIFAAHILDALLNGAQAVPSGPQIRPASGSRSAAAGQKGRDVQVLTSAAITYKCSSHPCRTKKSCTKVLNTIEPAKDGADSSGPDGGDLGWYAHGTERRPATEVLV